MSFPDPARTWTRVTVACPPEAADAVSTVLMGMCSNGVVSEDVGAEVRVTGYLSAMVAGNDPDGAVAAVKDALERVPAELLPRPINAHAVSVPERDWVAAFREHCRPLREGRIVIKPTWEEWPSAGLEAYDDDIVIELDPGMAFGTGSHATTRACLAAILQLLEPGGRVLDFGCGSGILSIAAALLEAGEVRAVDCDPLAIEVARLNLGINGVSDAVEIQVADTLMGQGDGWDLILANISAPAVSTEAPNAFGMLRDGGHYVCAGIPNGREDEVAEALPAAGFEVLTHDRAGEWHSFIARRPARGDGP